MSTPRDDPADERRSDSSAEQQRPSMVFGGLGTGRCHIHMSSHSEAPEVRARLRGTMNAAAFLDLMRCGWSVDAVRERVVGLCVDEALDTLGAYPDRPVLRHGRLVRAQP